jgi:hypothetical protein
MEIKLADYGRVFATRERARKIVDDAMAADANGESICIDLSGVSSASPSFMAELLTRAMVVSMSASIIGASEHLRWLSSSLIQQLGLVGRVRLSDPALA